MAASHPVAGEDVENGKGEEADAGGYKDDIEHGGLLRGVPLRRAAARSMALSAYKFAADFAAPI
jgi:hypothetical protein